MTLGFEGIDGVGKTTLANAVALATGGIAVASIKLPEIWRQERKAVNQGDDAAARFEYFLRFNAQNLLDANIVSAKGKIATLDTTLYRTIATHRVLGVAAALQAVPSMKYLPDTTFYIDLPETERITRMVGRDGGLVHPSHWDEKLHEHNAELREEYASFNLPILDGLQPVDALVKEVLQVCNLG